MRQGHLELRSVRARLRTRAGALGLSVLGLLVVMLGRVLTDFSAFWHVGVAVTVVGALASVVGLARSILYGLVGLAAISSVVWDYLRRLLTGWKLPPR